MYPCLFFYIDGKYCDQSKNIQQTHSSYQSRFILESLEGIIFKLSEDNIHDSAEMTLYLVYENFLDFPYYFICRFIYSSFISKRKDCTFYFMFIEEINTKEKDINPSINGLINEFVNFILSLNSNESFYLLEKMIEMNLISSSLVKDKNTFYFAHYIDNEDLSFYKNKNENYDELSANDYELHKKYITEGHNPDKIAKILQNDEIEKLQEISSQTNFNFNQYIKPSLYERYSYINHSFVSLIEYAAFFGSANCFKYLLMNDANVMYAGKYAIAGGNLEIIHLCEQNHASFENANETAIEFHRNNIFKYLYKK